jgi:hypothetical protein
MAMIPHDDFLYWVVTAFLLLVTGVVYAVLKRRQPNQDGGALFEKAEKWVEGIFFVLLVGGMVLITIRYS